MGGLHFFDLFLVLLVGLAIFGPKTLQSVARNVGKGAGQAKDIKDKLMEELPFEELSQVTKHVPKVPLSKQQALQMLIAPEKGSEPKGAAPPSEPQEKVPSTNASIENL